MATVKLDLKTAKLALKVSRTALTKAISEFEWAGQEFERSKDAARTKQELRSKVIGLVIVNILGLSRGQH